MIKLLLRYLAAEIALCTGFALLAFTGLFVFFDLLGDIGNIGKGAYRFIDVVIYVLFSMPGHIYELLPVATLIGGIFAISTLAANSELTVMRASGVSLLRLTGWLAGIGVVFALLTAIIGEYIGPAASKAGNRYRVQATKEVLVGDFQSGIWVKDGRQIANISAMNPDMTLDKLRIYEFTEGQRLVRIIDANSAHFDEKLHNWALTGSTVTELAPDQSRVMVSEEPERRWSTSVNPDMLAVLMVKPQDMSMRALMRYISHLRENSQETARYDLALWTKLFYPIACISMMLIALPFALLQRRSSNVGIRIFLGILLGVGFNFLSQVMGHLGALYRLPPPLAAGLPTLILVAIAAFVLWRQEKQ